MNHKTPLSAVSILMLLSLSVLILLARWHTITEPLERDFGTYSLIAHGLLQGRELYVDLWDIKLPAIYLTFASAQWLVGYNQFAIFLLGVFAALVTLFGVYVVGERLQKGVGLWAALFWTLICSDLYTQANQPNTEVFINACFVWALAIWLKRPQHITAFIGIGLLCVIATLYKQVAIFFAVFLGITYILQHKKPLTAIGQMSIAGLTGVFIWLGMIGYFVWKGHFDSFYLTNVEFIQGYSNHLLANIQRGFELQHLFPEDFKLQIPLTVLPIIGLIIGFWKKRTETAFLFSYALAIPIMVSLPSQFFAHYYQYWLPWLAITNAWAIYLIVEQIKQYKPTWKTAVQPLLVAWVSIIILTIQLPLYFLSADEWAYKKYGTLFIFSKQMAQDIDTILEPDEMFYQWSDETQLYLYTQRQSVTGIPFIVAFRLGAFTEPFLQKSLNQLQANPPALILLPLANPVPNNMLTRWIVQNYVPHPDNAQRMQRYRDAALTYIGEKSNQPLLGSGQLIFPTAPPLPPLGFFMLKGSDLEKRETRQDSKTL